MALCLALSLATDILRTTSIQGRLLRFPSMRRVAQLTVLTYIGQILFILWIGGCNVIGRQLLLSIFHSHLPT